MRVLEQLCQHIIDKQSFLCVGLDADLSKIPVHLKEGSGNPITAFNKAIIDATAEHCVAYKVNFAFYEAAGRIGLEALEETAEYIPDTHFKIADAKRGDIGNTASQYAMSIFDRMDFDAVTLSPYMGYDAIEPFLKYEDKMVIILALTSNASSLDFQFEKLVNGRFFYEEIVTKSQEWAGSDRVMFVVGATHPRQFSKLRDRAPNHFFLVPGVGKQGGDLEMVFRNGANEQIGLLVNSSRGIIFAGSGTDFAAASKSVAAKLHDQMRNLMLGH